MNKERRKQIAIADGYLAKAREFIELAKAELETARDDERAYFEDMPESFQGGEKGERADAAATALEEACEACDEADSACETASQHIETAGE